MVWYLVYIWFTWYLVYISSVSFPQLMQLFYCITFFASCAYSSQFSDRFMPNSIFFSFLQVRPKTLIPDSLPLSPCRDQPSKQLPAVQKATVVSIKNPTPALPTANNTVSHVQMPSSQSHSVAESTAITSPLSSTGVAYAIISTHPSNAGSISTSATVSVVNENIKVQPLLISADSKVGKVDY